MLQAEMALSIVSSYDKGVEPSYLCTGQLVIGCRLTPARSWAGQFSSAEAVSKGLTPEGHLQAAL